MRKILFISLLMMICAVGYAKSRKTVSILGDSYSTFEHFLQPTSNWVWYFSGKHDNTDVTTVQQTWWHQLISENGMQLCVNNSFSGSTICNTGYNKEDFTDRSFCTRLWNLGAPDIIFIFGGTNDSWAGSPIGDYKYSDWTKDDLYNYRPAMAYMIENTVARYPNTDVYFILNTELSDDITASSIEICNHYGITCIQLRDIDKMNGHPSIKGMKQIAEQVKKKMKR